MTLFLDFDGTIVDVSERYYQLHMRCLHGQKEIIPKNVYWTLKRDAVPEETIMSMYYPTEQFAPYEEKRMSLIEDANFLQYDSVIAGAIETLTLLKTQHRLILVTLRKRPDELEKQIDALHLRGLFDQIIVSAPEEGAWQTKAALIKPIMNAEDWIIGDTEADIQAGQELHLITCATLSGIRSENYLAALHPTHTIKDITGLPGILA